jgi:hypothetical protein
MLPLDPPSPTLQDYLISLPVVERVVLLHCCMERRPMLDVAAELGISPQYIARILLRALEFTEMLLEYDSSGTPGRIATAMETQTRNYLESQDAALMSKSASPFLEFDRGSGSYGAN